MKEPGFAQRPGAIAVDLKALERLVRDAAASVEGVQVAQATLSRSTRAAPSQSRSPHHAALPPSFLGALVQERIAEGPGKRWTRCCRAST